MLEVLGLLQLLGLLGVLVLLKALGRREVLRVLEVGLSRLCSATFEELLAFGATFCGFSNLEQVLPFRAIFEQNIGLKHISSTKKSTISWKTLHLAHRVRPPRLP